MTTTNTDTRNRRLEQFTAGHLAEGADTGQLAVWARTAEMVGDVHRGLLLTRSGRLLAETWQSRATMATYARTADVAATLGREALRELGPTCSGPGDGQAADITVARLRRYTGEAVVHAAYHQVCYDPAVPAPAPQQPVLGPEVTDQCRDADALVMMALAAGWEWVRHSLDDYGSGPELGVWLTRGPLGMRVLAGPDADGGACAGAVMRRTDGACHTVARGLEACAAVVAFDPQVAASWSRTVRVPALVARVRDLVVGAGGRALPQEQVPEVGRVPRGVGRQVSRRWEWELPWLGLGCYWCRAVVDVSRPLVGEGVGSPHVTPLGERVGLGCHRTVLTVSDGDGCERVMTERELGELLAAA